MAATCGVLMDSKMLERRALRSRQKSSSCSGRVPLSFSLTAAATVTMTRVQDSTASTSTPLSASSCDAASVSVILMSGTVSRTSPLTCCSVCETTVE